MPLAWGWWLSSHLPEGWERETLVQLEAEALRLLVEGVVALSTLACTVRGAFWAGILGFGGTGA